MRGAREQPGEEGPGAAALLLLLLLLLVLSRGVLGGESACPEGSFRASPEPGGCLPCDVCDQGRGYVSRCSPAENAVCRCPPGRACGGNACLPCAPEKEGPCAPGDRRTREAAGEPEEEGKRRRRRRSSQGPCSPFGRCPDDQIPKPGTEESDVVCEPEPTGPPTPTTGVFPSKATAPPESNGQTVPIAIALAVTALMLCLLALFLSCLVFRSWVREKSREGGFACQGQPAQEVDDCSYCYPEEEEGGDGPSKASGAKWELLLEKVP